MSKYGSNDISKLKDRNIFFDTNILIYLFGSTTPNDSWSKKYNSLFKQLIKQKNKFFIDFIVSSEFINKLHNIEYKKSKLHKEKYKKYRDAKEGKKSLKEIYITFEEDILKNFNIVGKCFSKNDISSFLNIDSLDFSDKGILSICKNNSFVLLTNDIDFKDTDIDILTVNNNILK